MLVVEKNVFNGKTKAVQSLQLETMSIDQLKALQELTKMQLSEIAPKKETAQNVINSRLIVFDTMTDLLTFSKTSKSVIKVLKTVSVEFFVSCLTDKQKETFNQSQFEQLVKSPKLVTKIFSEAQRTQFINDGLKCSPSTYLNAIKRGSCMKMTAFAKRRKLTV
jgi:hypothetical protein